MSGKFKIAFIGTGGRSVPYAKAYAALDDVEIVALADPKPEHRKTLAQRANLDGAPAEYDDWRDLEREQTDLDGVVICSPNHAHADQAVTFLERGVPMLLEKPLALTEAECRRVVEAERANAGRVVMGFVLREAGFYKQVRETIRSGALGALVNIQADELVGWGVSSIINRNEYKRRRETYGSLILSKCCHDMDILNWLVGRRPVAVHSFGRRMIFHPNPSLPETCEDCKVADQCKYYRKPRFSSEENADDAVMYEFMREDFRCIYNIDKDAIDSQSVAVEYEDGVIANFMVTLNCAGPRAGRNIHAIGLKGRLWGELHESKFHVFDNQSGTTTAHEIQSDGSGHAGGDSGITGDLLRMMGDPTYNPENNAYAGYLSAIVCLAAEVSRHERRRVDIRYGEDEFARLV